MSDFELVTSWLQSAARDYQTGLTILRKYSDNEFLLEMLEVEDAWNKQQLLESLQELANTLPKNGATEVTVRRKAAEEVIKQDAKTPSDRTDAPEEIKQTVGKRKGLYKEAATLYARLTLYPTDEERLAAAMRILDCFDEIAPLWDATDFYDLHGRMASKVEVVKDDLPSLDIVTLNQEWLRHYKYVRKFYTVAKHVPDCITRLARMEAIAQELNKQDAFQHERLIVPTIVTE